MHRHLLSILVLSVVVLLAAAKKRYDGNVLLSVVPSREEHFQLLMKLEDTQEITIWNELRRQGPVHVMFNQTQSSWLLPLFRTLDMQPSTMIDDVQQLLETEERTQEIQSRLGSPRNVLTKFQTYSEITQWLQELAATYQNLVTVYSIGKTYENRDIWVIRISAPGGTKKKAFLDFGIHAREWISPATGLYIINELVTTYGAGGDAKALLDRWEFHIVPVLNPDGYSYTHTNDRMWRKNRKPVGSGCFGVDLNRNFGYMFNTGGSSSQPCSDTFHGGVAMSENEAKALQQYMGPQTWDLYLTFHSYGQWWFTNWGYTTANPPNFATLKARATVGANAIRSVNGRAYTIGSSAQLLYIASGGSEDWTRGTLNIEDSYCLELPPTGGSGFIAPVSEIVKTGKETFVGVAAFMKARG